MAAEEPFAELRTLTKRYADLQETFKRFHASAASAFKEAGIGSFSPLEHDHFDVSCGAARVQFSFLFLPGGAAPTDVKGRIRCERLDPIADKVSASIGEFEFSTSGVTDLKVPAGMTVDIREEDDARDAVAYWILKALRK